MSVLRQRLFELLLDAEASAGARAQNSRRAWRLRSRQGASVSVSPRRTAGAPWRGSLPDPGNSKWGAGNLQTGAPSDPFVSGRTHQIELVAYGFLKVRIPTKPPGDNGIMPPGIPG